MTDELGFSGRDPEPPPSPEEVRFTETAQRILSIEPVMTLATSSAAGPAAADVYFAESGMRLYFMSSTSSLHSLNLQQDSRCAVTIHPAVSTWRQIVGLQLRGTAHPVLPSADRTQALQTYLSKFPFARDVIAYPGRTAAVGTAVEPHVFIPRWIRLIDNARSFGNPLVAEISETGAVGAVRAEKSAASR